MHITIISVGNRPKAEVSSLISNFTKRLPRQITVEWHYLKHGSGNPTHSKQQEAESILRLLSPQSRVVLLDETGIELTSPQLAVRLFHTAQDLTFIIGGAYGVADSIKQRATFVLSLGPLVLPHQIVRLILAEQLYRAHCIHTGHPYHHE